MDAGQIQEQIGGIALEQDPDQAHCQGHLSRLDVGHRRPRLEHGPQIIRLVVGVEHGHIAAVEVEQPFEPAGQDRPDGLQLLARRQRGKQIEQQGLPADIHALGQAAWRRPGRHAIRMGVQHR